VRQSPRRAIAAGSAECGRTAPSPGWGYAQQAGFAGRSFQKGLAFLREWSGTVTVPGIRWRLGILLASLNIFPAPPKTHPTALPPAPHVCDSVAANAIPY
jgi:hypothetical protein